MNKKILIGILIGIILIITIIIGRIVWLRNIPTIDELNTEVSNKSPNLYANKSLNFSITIPDGYRLASNYTKIYNTTGPKPVQDYADDKAEYILLTANSLHDENSFLNSKIKESEKYPLLLVRPQDLAKSEIKNSIEIFSMGVNIDELLKIEEYEIKQGKPPHMIDKKDVLVSNNFAAKRYTARDTLSGESFEIINIPVKSGIINSSGKKISGIEIRMNKRSEIFDSKAFDELVQSFKWNNE